MFVLALYFALQWGLEYRTVRFWSNGLHTHAHTYILSLAHTAIAPEFKQSAGKYICLNPPNELTIYSLSLYLCSDQGITLSLSL